MLNDLDINHGALGDWIKKEQTPNGINIAKIAAYFDVSTDYLLGLTDDPTQPNEKSSLKDLGETGNEDTQYILFMGRNGVREKIEVPKEKIKLAKKMLEALAENDTDDKYSDL